MSRLLSWLLMLLLCEGFLAAEAAGDLLGGEARIITNADGDTILMNGDKKFVLISMFLTAMTLTFTWSSKHPAESGEMRDPDTVII